MKSIFSSRNSTEKHHQVSVDHNTQRLYALVRDHVRWPIGTKITPCGLVIAAIPNRRLLFGREGLIVHRLVLVSSFCPEIDLGPVLLLPCLYEQDPFTCLYMEFRP